MKRGILFGLVSAQVLVSMMVQPAAFAAIGDVNTIDANNANATAPSAGVTSLEPDQSYVLSRGRLISYTTQNEEGQTFSGSVVLPAETEVTILSVDNQNGLVTLGIDTDEQDNMPSQMTVSMSELLAAGLVQLSPDDYATGEDEAAAGEELDAYYDVLVPTDVAGNHWKAHRIRRRGRKTPSCYRDVKKKLLAMGKVHSYPPGAAAWQGYGVLTKQYGFHPVKFSQSLPNGTVCISEGGRYRCGGKNCGHIAVKIGPFKWYGAGVFSNPLLPRHHNLRCVEK